MNVLLITSILTLQKILIDSNTFLYHYNMINKAIRDGKYLARHMPVLGNVHPIKIENVDIFFVTSFLCSLELLYY